EVNWNRQCGQLPVSFSAQNRISSFCRKAAGDARCLERRNFHWQTEQKDCTILGHANRSSDVNKKIVRSSVTPIGRVMSTFPVNPRYSKMLCLSCQSDLLPYTVALIS